MRAARTSTAALLATSLFLAGCGGEAAEEVAGSGDAAATEEVAVTEEGCEVVDGTDSPGDQQVDVVLDEWAVEPATTEVEAGAVTFSVTNEGEDAHELVIVRAPIEDLEVVDGAAQEDALPEGAFIGEIEGFPGGATCEGTFELEAGTYTLFCNIVETEDGGAMESHYMEGMATTFTVR